MIEHLRGREQALESLGWTGREAEWIALVCLHKIGLPDIKQILGPPVEAQRVTPLDRRSPVKQCLNETGCPVAPGIKIETELRPREDAASPPFPSRFIVSDRSSPSRVRCAASRPGLLRADPKDALLYEGKGGVGPWGARAGR